MDAENARLAGMVFAGIAVISTAVFYVFRYKEFKVLREIRDRLDPREVRDRVSKR